MKQPKESKNKSSKILLLFGEIFIKKVPSEKKFEVRKRQLKHA